MFQNKEKSTSKALFTRKSEKVQPAVYKTKKTGKNREKSVKKEGADDLTLDGTTNEWYDNIRSIMAFMGGGKSFFSTPWTSFIFLRGLVHA